MACVMRWFVAKIRYIGINLKHQYCEPTSNACDAVTCQTIKERLGELDSLDCMIHTVPSVLRKERLVLLGSEVDKPSKFFIRTLNGAEYIELDITKIEALRIDDLII